MFNVGDQVMIINEVSMFSQTLGKIGTITEVILPNAVVSVPMYDVRIDNDVYVLYDDEIQLAIPMIGVH